MIDPLIQKQPSRMDILCTPSRHALLLALVELMHLTLADIMFAAFMKSVNDEQASVNQFTELMRDDTSKEVFAQAAKSRDQKPMGITPWRHKDHPDWFRMDSKP